ncbi:MAG: hydantoinase/oxoprolinase N-terminal domain-containing protein [Anaerolineales bacterium]|nr:hydantoinase/oxoprolinase N-terminal domain-containing protein [Anaerolineales bacterium]
MENEPLRIGIDIGGTFTDFVVYDPSTQQIQTLKLLSTPRDPAEAVLEGLRRIQAESDHCNPRLDGIRLFAPHRTRRVFALKNTWGNEKNEPA